MAILNEGPTESDLQLARAEGRVPWSPVAQAIVVGLVLLMAMWGMHAGVAQSISGWRELVHGWLPMQELTELTFARLGPQRLVGVLIGPLLLAALMALALGLLQTRGMLNFGLVKVSFGRLRFNMAGQGGVRRRGAWRMLQFGLVPLVALTLAAGSARILVPEILTTLNSDWSFLLEQLSSIIKRVALLFTVVALIAAVIAWRIDHAAFLSRERRRMLRGSDAHD